MQDDDSNPTKLILILAACFGLGGFLLSSWLFKDIGGPALGTEFKELEFADINGKKFRLSDLRGKPVLINFWATWCPPCIEELPMLDAAHQRGQLSLIALAQDDRAEVRKFLKTHPLSAPVVLESDAAGIVKQFDVPNVLPFSVLLDSNGKVVYSHRGLMREADLAKALAKVKAP
jgi:thiol-disulfide isomerase/thioredoxin